MVSNINQISNPKKVEQNFKKYKGNDKATLELSEKPDKKYKVIYNGKTTHFGSQMEDYTKHGSESRRKSYLARSAGIKGNWKSNKYSSNNLSRVLLWQA